METQWKYNQCSYLRRQLWEMENLEQVQELRLPDGMADIARVLCVWGQPMVRSKQWRGDTVQVSGGVTAWVLYEPENGEQAQCVEVWLPFQSKHRLQQSKRDGLLRVQCCLRSGDARTLSSRKLMVRTSVGVLLEALEATQQPVYQPTELPEGVQLLEQSYPVLLPAEAGERLVSLEADVSGKDGRSAKVLCCTAEPEVTETEMVGLRAVMRGICRFKTVYLTENGSVMHQQSEASFAQYADMEKTYENGAALGVMPAVSALEAQLQDGIIHIQCSLILQYALQAQQLLSVVEDAYSPAQAITPILEKVSLPVILDTAETELLAECALPEDAARVLECSFFPDLPTQYRDEMGTHCLCSGSFQLLYYDGQSQLCCENLPWNGEWILPQSTDCSLIVQISGIRQTHEGAYLRLRADFVSDAAIPMVCGLNVGERNTAEADRPSMLLQRMGEGTLWELAKATGSTVEAIRRANRLTQEPDSGQMLLIPLYR